MQTWAVTCWVPYEMTMICTVSVLHALPWKARLCSTGAYRGFVAWRWYLDDCFLLQMCVLLSVHCVLQSPQCFVWSKWSCFIFLFFRLWTITDLPFGLWCRNHPGRPASLSEAYCNKKCLAYEYCLLAVLITTPCTYLSWWHGTERTAAEPDSWLRSVLVPWATDSCVCIMKRGHLVVNHLDKGNKTTFHFRSQLSDIRHVQDMYIQDAGKIMES